MAVTYGFFNSVNGDRKYNAEQMSEYFRGIINEGVYQHLDGGLAVTAGTGLAVNVAAGRAIIQNRWIQNSAAMSLTIAAASETYPRKDAVVIRLNWSSRAISIAVKTGTPAASPVAPSMTRSSTTYEMALAYVNVAANATSVTVTDKRSDSTVCGWVTVAQSTSGEVDAQLNAMKTGFDGVTYSSPAAMVQGCDTKIKAYADEKAIATNRFTVNGNTTHSSTLDTVHVNIVAGMPYVVYKSSGTIYAFYTDNTYEAISAIGIASKTIEEIGIYYANSSSSPADISFSVVYGDTAVEMYNKAQIAETSGITVKSITVSANTNHSAYEDRINVPIMQGQKYIVLSNANLVYVFYSDGTYEAVSGEKIATKNVSYFGMSHNNTTSSAINLYLFVVGGDNSVNMYNNALVGGNSSVLTKRFTIPANTTHSSRLDTMKVDIKYGTKFFIVSNYGIPYVFYTDGTYESLVTGVASKDIESIGIYYVTSSSSVDVEFCVVCGDVSVNSVIGDIADYRDSKMESFTDLFNGSESIDTYFFYTDSHFMSSNSELTPKNINYIFNFYKTLRLYANQCDPGVVISGGDFLTADDTKDAACYKLNFLKGTFDKFFPRKNHYMIFGNHDTNYQGIDHEGSADNTGELSQNTINNIMYRESNTKKSYYTIETFNTKYYCFDSGTDWDDIITSYRQEQLDWFADGLKNDNSKNIVIMIHIFSRDASLDPSGVNFADRISAFATKIMEIITAYNGRTSITVDDVNYDYSAKTGKIWFVQCGHTHYDYVYTGASVPVVCTRNATAYGDGPAYFDMAFIDYTNEVLHLIRVNGTDRTVNL